MRYPEWKHDRHSRVDLHACVTYPAQGLKSHALHSDHDTIRSLPKPLLFNIISLWTTVQVREKGSLNSSGFHEVISTMKIGLFHFPILSPLVLGAVIHLVITVYMTACCMAGP